MHLNIYKNKHYLFFVKIFIKLTVGLVMPISLFIAAF